MYISIHIYNHNNLGGGRNITTHFLTLFPICLFREIVHFNLLFYFIAIFVVLKKVKPFELSHLCGMGVGILHHTSPYCRGLVIGRRGLVIGRRGLVIGRRGLVNQL